MNDCYSIIHLLFIWKWLLLCDGNQSLIIGSPFDRISCELSHIIYWLDISNGRNRSFVWYKFDRLFVTDIYYFYDLET